MLHSVHNCSARLITSALKRAHKTKLFSNCAPGNGVLRGFASLSECAFLRRVCLCDWFVFCHFTRGSKRPSRTVFPLNEPGVSRKGKTFLVFKAHLRVGLGAFGWDRSGLGNYLMAPEGLRFLTWTDDPVSEVPGNNRVTRESRKKTPHLSLHRLFIHDQIPAKIVPDDFLKESQMF